MLDKNLMKKEKNAPFGIRDFKSDAFGILHGQPYASLYLGLQA